MRDTHPHPLASELRERFRQLLLAIEAPLERFQTDMTRNDELMNEDRTALSARVAELSKQLEAALDLEKLPPALRHELFALVLQPDSPEALDDLDDKIIDRLLGYAVRAADLEDMV